MSRRSSSIGRRYIAVLAIAVSIAMLATACSDSPSKRSAAGSAGDPVLLPALAGRSGTGPSGPVFTGSVIGPETWVATSLAPTLSVPNETGAWTFTLDDFGGTAGGFTPVVVRSSGTSAAIALSDGLKQGHVYAWRAEGPEGRKVSGTFQVDVEMREAQASDSTGTFDVGLSSGAASFSWTSHSMSSVAGSVGFSLRHEVANAEELGVPAGWDLQVASSSDWTKVIVRPSGTIALVGTNGSVSNYRASADGFVPVELSSTSPELLGLAPVLIRNGQGNWSVIGKNSTSVFVDDDGDGTADLSTVFAQGRAVLAQESTKGRITSVTDPVSKRSISFIYGGASCPSVPAGFVNAPKDQLCQVKFWDGSTSAINYVVTPAGATTIGRIVDYPEAGGDGAQVTDVAYDGAGRIGAVRTPLVAAAVASKVVPDGDDSYLLLVAYDSAGRVASVAKVAPDTGAQRCTRTYSYLSDRATRVDDSCWGGAVRTITFDPSTFFPLTDTDQSGGTQTYDWEFTSGHLLRSVGTTGMVTETTYRDGQVWEVRGPSRDLGTAKVSRTQYDQRFANAPEGVDLKGLDATYWPANTDAASAGTRQLGPLVDGQLSPSLLVNWSSSPAGTGGAWSAIMTGTLEVVTAGKYTFGSASAGTSVRINNVLCIENACRDMQLGAGRQQIRVDLAVPQATGSMDVTWSGPDTGGSSTSIPTDRLRPQYGYTTTARSIDPTAVSAPVEAVTRTEYSAPEKAQIGATANQAGLRTTMAYEAGTGGDGGWGRQNATTSAGGSSYGFSYWGDTESAKSSCPGAKQVNQGGASRVSTAPSDTGTANGRSTSSWYDAAGRVVGATVAGGATTCTTYDTAGRVAGVQLLGMGSTQKTTTAYSVGGDPRITEVTSVQGSSTTTSRSEVDLLGRTVSTTDRYGIVVTTQYDPRTGSPALITTTAPGLAPSVESRSYDAAGRLATVVIDGRTMSTSSYGPTGLLARVVYGNGLAAAIGYDAADQIVSVSWNGPMSASATRVISGAGKTSAMTLTVDGASSRFDYGFDTAMRLAKVSVTEGLVTSARTWTYAYDANSNRVRQTATGGPVAGDWTYSYDGASRLVSTDDPAVVGAITYDDRGNATQMGADAFTYDAADFLIGATDGSRSVTYERSVTGAVLAKTTSEAGKDTTIRYASSGYTLGADGAAVGRQVALPGGVTVDLSPSKQQWRFSGIDGNILFVTDDAGARQGMAQVFEPFGRLLTAPLAPSPDLPSTSWQMTSNLETESLSLAFVMMGARVYLPAIGRFIQLDPVVGGSANGYDYANQDPVDRVDPSGESTLKTVATGVAWLLAAVLSVFVQNWVGAAMAAQGFSAAVAGTLTGAIVAVVGDSLYQGITVGLSYAMGVGNEAAWNLGETGLSVVVGGIAGRIAVALQVRAATRAAAAAAAQNGGGGAPVGAALGQPPVAAGQLANANVVAGGGVGAAGNAAGNGVARGSQALPGPLLNMRPLSNRLSGATEYLSFLDPSRDSFRTARNSFASVGG